MSPGVAGSGPGIRAINFTGPILSLLPNNGIAILTGEGFVDFINGVNVGAPGQGALVYMSSQNAARSKDATQFQRGNMTVYGSVIYDTDIKQGQFQAECTGDMSITYDPAFLNNPGIPDGLFTSGSINGVKINYDRK